MRKILMAGILVNFETDYAECWSDQMAATQQQYFHPRRLGHVNLWVEDLARSERFYNECCGLTVEFSEPDLIATFLGTGQTPTISA